MTEKDIKPIPRYIEKLIKRTDKKAHTNDGTTRFYAYLAIWKKELVKVTVAVKEHKGRWLCKQVAVHTVKSDRCYIKDIVFYYMGGYVVGWHDEQVYKNRKWFETGEWDWHLDHLFDPDAPIVNRELALKLPEYQYSAVNLYTGSKIIQYLRNYLQYPQVEYFSKLGLSQFVFSKQLLKKSSKDKKFRKWLASNSEILSSRLFYVATLIKSYKTGINPIYTQAYDQTKKQLPNHRHCKRITELFNGDLESFYRYIAKQDTNLHTYADYLDACIYLGLDLTEEKHRIPHDFKRWHDIRTDEENTQRALKDAEERKKLCAKFNGVAEKYSALQHNKRSAFISVIARSPDELIAEGKSLHHCVGGYGYAQRFVREESLIFFIRSRAKPDVPFVTVEYSLQEHKIMQCYGNRDKPPAPNVSRYVHEVWLPHVRNQLAA